MKLLHKSYLQASVLLIPALIIGAIFSYLIIRYIIYEESDEFLTYEMQRIVAYHDRFNDLPDDHQAVRVIEATVPHEAFFRDTLILEPADNEYIPHRELHFGLTHNGNHFTLVLRNLLPGNDDLLEGTVLIMAGMMVLLIIIFILMVSGLSKRTWSPFYQTLFRLKEFQLGKPLPRFKASSIDEFENLHTTLEGLLKKINTDFQRTKEFNENASHEFQTHLAVIRSEVENLMNLRQLDEQEALYLQRIHRSTLSLSRVQNSLLLLSRIGNQEFTQSAPVNLKDVIHRTVELYSETIELRNIQLQQELEATVVTMDPGLADIFITNLIKNAVKHNIHNGSITIRLSNNTLHITNSGTAPEANPEELMERYVKGKNGNMGIGLAIVHQIAELYHFQVNYTVEPGNQHQFTIVFS